MLTLEAMDDRAWFALTALRELLAGKRREFENGLYPTSTSDSEFDVLRRTALLAALVSANEATIVEVISGERDTEIRASRGEAILRDLGLLRDLLHSMAQRLEHQDRDVGNMQEHVYRAAMTK